LQLEQMGFDGDLVLEVFFACNKDEHLAANYLLDHMNEFGDEVHDGRRCNGGTHWIAVAT
jgi:hypothetical protein